MTYGGVMSYSWGASCLGGVMTVNHIKRFPVYKKPKRFELGAEHPRRIDFRRSLVSGMGAG